MIGERIHQARIGAGLSLRELAERANGYVSAQAIHKYELGKDIPGSDVLIKLGSALGVKVEFFLRPSSASVTLGEPAYRKRSNAPAKEREAIRARAKEWVEKYLEVESLFPSDRFLGFKMPKESDRSVRNLDGVETAARNIRRYWALGNDAIEKLCEVLEDRGIKVALVEAGGKIDGMSCWANGNIPVLLVKKGQTSDRLRFSIAHELGHLLLECSPSLNSEKVADRFAGSFLVPEEAAKAELGECRHSLSLYELRGLREKYGMSVQAWIHRARDLGIISESFYSRAFRALKAEGLHNRELGEPLAADEPKRFERLVAQAAMEGLISPSKGAEWLNISLNEFRSKLTLGTSDAVVHP